MYLIDKEKNNISEIPEKKFSELGFKERDHLQEWIAKNPSCLGEELLIIQKEFSDFPDTNERLDLLALDQEGNLVVIENKLDDTGRDVVWQALKYASYCSSLTKKQILDIFQDYLNKQEKNENAEEKIKDFFKIQELEEKELNKEQSQRIFFIASNFRKEVTSTALYLINYNMRVKCFKVTPFQLNESLILNVEQIIPTKDSEDYMIKMAKKNQENIVERKKVSERNKVNQEFWAKFLEKINSRSDMFQNRSPSKDSWLNKNTKIGSFNPVISRTYARVELYIDVGEKEYNKKFYDELLKDKEAIESELGYNLEWERLENRRCSRIKYEIKDVNINNKEDWDKMIDFLIKNVIKFEKVFSNRIQKLKEVIK